MKSKLLIGAALAGMAFASSQSYAKNHDKKESKAGECYGVNKCKGVGECGGKDDVAGPHSCHGKNSCKGKGWLKLDKETCEKLAGATFKE